MQIRRLLKPSERPVKRQKPLTIPLPIDTHFDLAESFCKAKHWFQEQLKQLQVELVYIHVVFTRGKQSSESGVNTSVHVSQCKHNGTCVPLSEAQ